MIAWSERVQEQVAATLSSIRAYAVMLYQGLKHSQSDIFWIFLAALDGAICARDIFAVKLQIQHSQETIHGVLINELRPHFYPNDFVMCLDIQ